MNFLNNIYIFSKLSIILILTSILILMGYLFYRSYKTQSNLQDLRIEEENIIVDLINSNSEKIEKLNFRIEALNNNVLQINKKNQLSQNNNKEISNEVEIIFDEIKDQIQSLSAQVKNIKKITENNLNLKTKFVNNNSKTNNINEIINLIKLKFESGKNFSVELDVLSSLDEKNIIPVLEQMYVLNNSNFKGNENLLLEFQNETNKYISNVIISKNNLIKPLLSFIEVQPSNKKNIHNKSLINLKKINQLIIKKEYEKSFIILKSLNNYNEYFKKTIAQIIIGKSFYSALDGII